VPAYQFRIQLRGVSPPIWRRVLVDAESTIGDLHLVFQRSMGWADEHLNQFIIRGRKYGVPKPGGVDFAYSDQLKLAAFGFRVHERFVYEYDFISAWLHDVRVEKILHEIEGIQVPVCRAGVGACPPEECGSPERYMHALDEHGEFDFYEWLDERFKQVRRDLDVEDFRDELEAWRPWVERAFDRKAANARLRACEAST